MKNSRIIIILFLCVLLFLSLTCTGIKKQIRDYRVKKKSSYRIIKARSLGDLVDRCPPVVLEAWKKWDCREDYRPYLPTDAEKARISADLLKLPPLTRRVMKKRLLGIYFITNILGSGRTDWVLDKEGNMYCYLVFNPRVLHMGMSELISWKEQTCFRKNSGDEKIEISVSGGESGFFYIALHESTHLVDYVRQVTPYTEEEVKTFYAQSPKETAFTRNTWCGLNKTCRTWPFTGKVRFYGLGGPPLADRREAIDLYRGLENSPFFSLYGTMNWAEDLAEFLTFYHLTQKMGFTYTITIKKQGKEVYSSEPAASPLVKKRFPTLQSFYRQP